MEKLGVPNDNCPVAPPRRVTVHTRVLHRACQIMGGVRHLARHLKTTPEQLHAWLEGEEVPPPHAFLKAVDLILKPGEISLHHIKLVHGSEPNTSDDRRIGMAIRYIPPHVRQLKVSDSAILVRGKDKYRNFEYEQRPKADLDEAALATHKESVERQVAALYSGTDKKVFRA